MPLQVYVASWCCFGYGLLIVLSCCSLLCGVVGCGCAVSLAIVAVSCCGCLLSLDVFVGASLFVAAWCCVVVAGLLWCVAVRCCMLLLMCWCWVFGSLLLACVAASMLCVVDCCVLRFAAMCCVFAVMCGCVIRIAGAVMSFAVCRCLSLSVIVMCC